MLTTDPSHGVYNKWITIHCNCFMIQKWIHCDKMFQMWPRGWSSFPIIIHLKKVIFWKYKFYKVWILFYFLSILHSVSFIINQLAEPGWQDVPLLHWIPILCILIHLYFNCKFSSMYSVENNTWNWCWNLLKQNHWGRKSFHTWL